MTYADLCNSIEERLLEFAALYNEVTTSDLQGIATAEARAIVADCRLADMLMGTPS